MLLSFLPLKSFTQFTGIRQSTNYFSSLAPVFFNVMKNEMETHIPLYTNYELHSYQVVFAEYRVHSVNVIRWIKSECFLLLLLTADVGSFIHLWYCMIVFEPFRCFHYFCLFFILFLVVQTCVRGERMFSSTNLTHIEFMMFYVNCGTQLEYKTSQTYGFKQPELLAGIQYNGKWKKNEKNRWIANHKRSDYVCLCVYVRVQCLETH